MCGFFEQVPQRLLVASALCVAKLVLVARLERLGLLLHLLVDVLLPLKDQEEATSLSNDERKKAFDSINS
jgi:hypothetical protein